MPRELHEKPVKAFYDKAKKLFTKKKGTPEELPAGVLDFPAEPVPKPEPNPPKEVPTAKTVKKPVEPYTDPQGKQWYVSPSGKLHPWNPEKATTQKKEPLKKWTSAGGVVISSMDDLDRIYVIKPANNYGPWAFPKGRVDAGESFKQAAVREVWEETGLRAKILPGSHSYVGKGAGGFSITHYFLMVRVGGTPQATDETEKVKLVTWEEAESIFKRAGNKRDVKIARMARQILMEFYGKG